jgi:hypothetical protein
MQQRLVGWMQRVAEIPFAKKVQNGKCRFPTEYITFIVISKNVYNRNFFIYKIFLCQLIYCVLLQQISYQECYQTMDAGRLSVCR